MPRREQDDLEETKHCFTATISADYQQSKLIPSWGKTEQPGSTYYLQKVSHNIFGIVDHSDDKSVVYVFDEHIGPKNTDHTISFLEPAPSPPSMDSSTCHLSRQRNKYQQEQVLVLLGHGDGELWRTRPYPHQFYDSRIREVCP